MMTTIAATEDIDVAVVGGGPAGLQAALVLARAGRRTVVFDAPAPPRNAASHGVHNVLGLDGLLPEEIRERAWEQIDRYGAARLVAGSVTDVAPDPGSGDLLVRSDAVRVRARHVLLACGYRDRHPGVEGFAECWGDTIIPCPFCDGFENRGRRWGIVPTMAPELDVFPQMTRNWTDDRLVIAPRGLAVDDERRAALDRIGVPLHVGDITAIEHTGGKVERVRLDDGTALAVETLLWTPEEETAPLVARLAETLGLALDAEGHVVVDDAQRTNVARVWAAGDVQGWAGAVEAAGAANVAASMIVRDWYADGPSG